VGAGADRHVPGRLLRDPDGRAGDQLPVQRHGGAHVPRQHAQLPGHRAVEREAGGAGADGAGRGRVCGRQDVRGVSCSLFFSSGFG